MEIHKIKIGQGAILRDVRLKALADSPLAFGAKLSDEERMPIQEFNTTANNQAISETTTTFLAFKDNAVIGQIGAFIDKTSSQSFICAMWVSPSHRRAGVGRKLVSSAVSWLNLRGADKVFAWVSDENDSAINFYMNIGFTATNEQQVLPSNKNTKETLYVITKRG